MLIGKVTHPSAIFVYITSPRAVYIFFFQTLNFLVESLGLLNYLFPLPSIMDSGYPVIYLHFAEVLFDVMLPSVVASSCDLLVRGFQLNIFLTVLFSGILCM